ncbi:Poly [ADP-ribose] polymerase 2 [Sarracenia purpurea var. burkii]
MAKKLEVEELRAELAQRGLSTTGTKPTLVSNPSSSRLSTPFSVIPPVDFIFLQVRRFESAIREEAKQSIDSTGDSTSKKRHRETENEDSNGSYKIKQIGKFRDMSVRELRKEAALQGFSTSGSKKELLERLCNDFQKDSEENIIEVKEEETAERKEEKMVTATKKGAAVLDQWLPDHIKTQYHVLQLGDEIYDAMLNQTNVGENNNKFYVIQVLESDDGGRFIVYNRWGRVGVKGQDKLHGPYTLRDSAIKEFEQKFLAKTNNYWSDRNDFICHPKCYTWLEMDYTDREKETTDQGKSNSTIGLQLRETKLESRIAKFISLICNISMMKQQMMEIGYNADKLPLGKLSKSTILKGYGVLKRIADMIGQSDRTKLEKLSGEFYTVIPHDFGFKKMREYPFSLPSLCLPASPLNVEALGEIEVATKLLEDDIHMQEDPLCSHYQRLHCELMPLEVDSKEFSMIATYMKNTHAKTHSNYTVDIVQIFRVSREGEIERFRKFSNTKNRMLLWHGSRLTNWTGILSQGLRIAPPEAPSTGYMFGKGVYFADMFSKSANYCYSTTTVTDGVLLLCEVALGDMAELLTANYNADKLPEGKLSTKGVGSTAPDSSEVQMLEDGVVVPQGKPKEQRGSKGALLYNEYIVYNVDQIRMRYVVQVNFNFKR